MDKSSGKGKLIVIEGLDGSGKTTQVRLLCESLLQSGESARLLSFPDYESESSALVRMYLSGNIGALSDVNLYAASAFYACDRYISFEKGWKKDYNSGTILLADRYTTSNIPYQMSKLDESEWDSYIDWLYEFEFDKLGLPAPDAVIYLDMSPEYSRRLLDKRYGGDAGKLDIHESNMAYLENCRRAALYAAGKLGWKVLECVPEGGGEAYSIEEMLLKIKAIISLLLWR